MKFLACRFVLVEYRTIRASAEDGSVEKKKKEKDKCARFVHQDIQSNPLTRHEPGNVTFVSKTSRVSIRALHFTSIPERPRECIRMLHAAIWELWNITGVSLETNGKGRREIIRGLHLERILPVCSAA